MGWHAPTAVATVEPTFGTRGEMSIRADEKPAVRGLSHGRDSSRSTEPTAEEDAKDSDTVERVDLLSLLTGPGSVVHRNLVDSRPSP